MPILALTGRIHPDHAVQRHVAGEVHAVLPDSFVPNEEMSRRMIFVRVPGGDEAIPALQKKWLHSGVPDDVQATADAETARFMADSLAYEKAKAAYDPVRDFLVAAPSPPKPIDRSLTDPARPELWPQRMVVVDLAQLDQEKLAALDACLDAYSAVEADREAAHDDAAFSAVAEITGVTVSAATMQKGGTALQKSIGARADALSIAKDALGASVSDVTLDAVTAAGRVAANDVEAQAVAALPVPEMHVLDADALDKAALAPADIPAPAVQPSPAVKVLGG